MCVSDSKALLQLAGLLRELDGIAASEAFEIGEFPAKRRHFRKMRAGHERPVGLRLGETYQKRALIAA